MNTVDFTELVETSPVGGMCVSDEDYWSLVSFPCSYTVLGLFLKIVCYLDIITDSYAVARNNVDSWTNTCNPRRIVI